MMLELLLIFFVGDVEWKVNFIDSPDGWIDCNGKKMWLGCTNYTIKQIIIDKNNLHVQDGYGNSLFDHEYKHATDPDWYNTHPWNPQPKVSWSCVRIADEIELACKNNLLG